MVFDAGALLAILDGEPGANEARAALPAAKMSAVNRAEVLAVLVRDGMPVEEADRHVDAILAHVIPFDRQLSALAGSLWPATAPPSSSPWATGPAWPSGCTCPSRS